MEKRKERGYQLGEHIPLEVNNQINQEVWVEHRLSKPKIEHKRGRHRGRRLKKKPVFVAKIGANSITQSMELPI